MSCAEAVCGECVREGGGKHGSHVEEVKEVGAAACVEVCGRVRNVLSELPGMLCKLEEVERDVKESYGVVSADVGDVRKRIVDAALAARLAVDANEARLLRELDMVENFAHVTSSG